MAIVKVYADISMAKGVVGLTKILEADGIDVNKGDTNFFYLFMNSKQTQAKLLARKHYVVHIRKEFDVITVEDIKAITEIFGRPMFGSKALSPSQAPRQKPRETLFTVSP